MDTLCGAENMTKVTKTLKELNLNFNPMESQVFTLAIEDSFNKAYSPHDRENIEAIAKQLGSLCSTLGELPIIRYGSSGRPGNAKLAVTLQSVIDNLKKDNPKMMASGASKKRSQLLIIDRGFDLISPLMHELTYQASIHEFLDVPVSGDFEFKFTDGSGAQQARKVQLNEDDKTYIQLRHLHFAEYCKEIPKLLEKFLTAAKTTMLKSESKSISELKKQISNVPGHQKMSAIASLHSELATQIQLKVDKKCELVLKTEQNLVTGLTEEDIKIKDNIKEITSVLIDRSIQDNNKLIDRNIQDNNKLRLLMLLVLGGCIFLFCLKECDYICIYIYIYI